MLPISRRGGPGTRVGRSTRSRLARRGTALVLVGAAALCATAAPAPAAAVPFKVVAHASVAGQRIGRQALADVFLQRVIKWGDGSRVRPVDLQLSSAVRQTFTTEILGLTALEVQQHWVREMSRGRVPPPAKKSDAEVLSFVASNPGAIGYVAAETPTPTGVKVLEVE